jgi:hypothetical protein
MNKSKFAVEKFKTILSNKEYLKKQSFDINNFKLRNKK